MQLKDQDICMNYTQPENAHHKFFYVNLFY